MLKNRFLRIHNAINVAVLSLPPPQSLHGQGVLIKLIVLNKRFKIKLFFNSASFSTFVLVFIN